MGFVVSWLLTSAVGFGMYLWGVHVGQHLVCP